MFRKLPAAERRPRVMQSWWEEDVLSNDQSTSTTPGGTSQLWACRELSQGAAASWVIPAGPGSFPWDARGPAEACAGEARQETNGQPARGCQARLWPEGRMDAYSHPLTLWGGGEPLQGPCSLPQGRQSSQKLWIWDTTPKECQGVVLGVEVGK